MHPGRRGRSYDRVWKDGNEGVYITPTVRHALAVARCGADIETIDGAARPRPDGRDLAATIAATLNETNALVLADVSTLDEGLAAADAAADAVASTLSGYIGPDAPPPDRDLVDALAGKLTIRCSPKAASTHRNRPAPPSTPVPGRSS